MQTCNAGYRNPVELIFNVKTRGGRFNQAENTRLPQSWWKDATAQDRSAVSYQVVMWTWQSVRINHLVY